MHRVRPRLYPAELAVFLRGVRSIMADPNATPMVGSDILVECVDPSRRGSGLRLSRRRQHADSPGADARCQQRFARSCRGTSRAAASWPRAMPAAPARSASASPPAAPAPPTSSPASPTPRWIPCPIVAITGQVGTPVIGTDAFQETPIVEVCRAITKHHYLVQRTEDIPRVVKEAFHIASTGRPGPVIVDVPKDVQNRTIAARLRSADEPARL